MHDSTASVDDFRFKALRAFNASTVRFKVMLFHTMTFVTTWQSSNKFDFALTAPKVLSPASYESGIAERKSCG